MSAIDARALDRERKRRAAGRLIPSLDTVRPDGRHVLAQRRLTAAAFVDAARRLAGGEHA